MSNSEKKFALQYDRTPEGWIKFPVNSTIRKEKFYKESHKHPAKTNPEMVIAVTEFVSEPGETILDPFGGTGTLMLASEMGRKVILMDENPLFHFYQQESKILFVARGVPEENIMLLHGDCRKFLPLAGIDHCMFSPPFADTMNFKVSASSQKDLAGSTYIHADGGNVFEDYAGTADNLSRLKPFQFNFEMQKIYQKLFDTLRPGGTMTVFMQDQMKNQKRICLSDQVLRFAYKVGFELFFWDKRYCQGSGFKKSMKAKGFDVVEDEDIIILQRPVK
jgi:hypothetical protein